MVYYCGAECRDTFESNHFWGTARWQAIDRATIFPIEKANRREGREVICARCEAAIKGVPEVNHIRPLNGDREFFGCQHHVDGLEVLCHEHHVRETRVQRRDGRIGTPEMAAAIRASDEVKRQRAEQREARLRANPQLL